MSDSPGRTHDPGRRIGDLLAANRRAYTLTRIRLVVNDKAVGRVCAPGRVRNPDMDSIHRFTCDPSWAIITDAWHETVDEALRQAEFEYRGVTSTWVWVVERKPSG